MFPFWNCNSQHSERSIIPLALYWSCHKVSLKIPPPQNADGAMGANHVGVGAYFSPNLAQMWENGKKLQSRREIRNSNPQTRPFPGFWFGGCWLNLWWCHQKFISAHYKYRGYGEHWELYTQHEKIYVHGMAKQVTHPFLSVPRSIRG